MSLKGKTIVFTGTLTMKRSDATKIAKDAGATVTGSVSAKTDYLVTGAATGAAKMADAEKKGVKCISESEFESMCKGGAEPKSSAAAKTEAASTKVAPKAKQVKAPAKKKAEAAADEEEGSPKQKKKSEPAAPAPAAAGGKRTIPVDREVPGRGDYVVVEDWSIKLNQTNIDGNNNKFYVIQVLKSTKEDAYYAWNRWGRVGEPGQNKLEKCGSLAGAISSFEKKFKDKTLNHWSARSNFKKHDGKYQLVETEEQEGDSGDGKEPIGKLSKAQIEKGQVVLGQIQNGIASKVSRDKLVSLSSTFFSLIPHDFGRRVPEPILTTEKASEKEEMLKFYLRMGFETVEKSDDNVAPIAGVMEQACPPTLEKAASGCCAKHFITNCVSKGDTLAKKNAGSPKVKMSKELYAAILLYTSNAIYKDLNKVLRDENRSGVMKYFSYLRLLFEATNTLPQNKVTLWRGISVDLYDSYKVGNTITWWGVSSCTSDINVAKNFMKSCGNNCTLLTIETKTACDISQITFYSNEKESLLLPGTMLKVKSSKKVGKVTEITMEEVGRAVE